ncbi:MAG: ATP-binding protein [Nanoarchaeota archaeon]
MNNHKDKLMIYIDEERAKLVGDIKNREAKLKIETDLINDIVGPRRAGKTSLMKLEMRELTSNIDKKRVIYINFENRKLYPLTPEYFNDIIQIIYEEEILKLGKIYLFLDEIRRIKNWEKYVRSIYDEFKGKIKIFISGSTSKLTKTSMSYLLSGRHLTSIVFPLSFREFLYFNGINFEKPIIEEKEARIKKALKNYQTLGGFPEVVLTKNDEIIEILFLDIINRDIAPNVENKEILEDVSYFLCSNSARLTSFSKLANLLKSRGISISVPTLEKYFNLMKDAFLFFDNTIFSYKVKDQLQYPRKIYCIDNGFVNYFGFKFSEDAGRLMENSVAIQLYRISQQYPKTKIFYFKTPLGEEVDFVVKDGLKIKQLIQVCYDMEDDDTKEREINALIKASKELKCNNLLVITNDKRGEETINKRKIKFVPLWRWLLEEK